MTRRKKIDETPEEKPLSRRARRRPLTPWSEPKRKGGPTMTADQVREALGFRDVESVHLLVEYGPNRDGLPGYMPTGRGEKTWELKTGRGHPGERVMFYAEDVQEYKRRHPIKEATSSGQPVPYTQEEYDLVLAEAAPFRAESSNGSVKRMKFLTYLADKYGHKYWNARTYKKLKQILDDAGVPLPPEMPVNTSLRRTSRKAGAGDQGQTQAS